MAEQVNIADAISLVNDFRGDTLTSTIAQLEKQVVGKGKFEVINLSAKTNLDANIYSAAKIVKQASRQIDVIIHTIGILRSLEYILERGEVVESVSLGAGNTGKKFDLETTHRIAEYKFIDWQGGAESIRQNGIFKDFYNLAEHETSKRKILYVNGTIFPLKFFNGGRALTSVLSRQPQTLTDIGLKYGANLKTVRDYYELHKTAVNIEDVSSVLTP